MAASEGKIGEKGRPAYLGTRREIADSQIRRCHRALWRARFGGKGNREVIMDKLNDWLEYRHRAQEDGVLDEEVWL